MRDILSCVCGLLMSPEPDDPLDRLERCNMKVIVAQLREKTSTSSLFFLLLY